jgi:hypothetical protein
MVDRTQAARVVDEPEPCFVRLRLVTNGPYVAARIFHRLGFLAAEINGKPADPMRVWHGGDLIDKERYDLMMTDPHPAPHLPVYVSDAGLADAVREANEMDYWFTQPIR